MSLKYSLQESFGFAFQGIKSAFQSEPNFRIHIFLATLAIILGILLNLSSLEWLILALTISFVMTLELLNTVLERLVDLVSPEIRREAKIAKDLSAAMVLLNAILAVAVGGFLFIPKISLILAR